MIPILFLLYVALQLADYALTARILDRGGLELNPLVRTLIDTWGKRGLVVAKLVAVAVGGVALLYERADIVLGVLCALYALVAGWKLAADDPTAGGRAVTPCRAGCRTRQRQDCGQFHA